MKNKRKILLIIVVLIIIAVGIKYKQNQNKYEGYWCKYDETSTIVVLLENDIAEKSKKAVENKIDDFENVISLNYYSREDYANIIGIDINETEIYASFIITLDTMDHIGTYIEELSSLTGVKSAEQSYAKMNISLYNIKDWGKYTYTNSDEATETDLEYGTFKIKKGIITFTPEEDNAETKILYTKDGYLCGDAACTKIYARSNSTCSANEQ